MKLGKSDHVGKHLKDMNLGFKKVKMATKIIQLEQFEKMINNVISTKPVTGAHSFIIRRLTTWVKVNVPEKPPLILNPL